MSPLPDNTSLRQRVRAWMHLHPDFSSADLAVGYGCNASSAYQYASEARRNPALCKGAYDRLMAARVPFAPKGYPEPTAARGGRKGKTAAPTPKPTATTEGVPPVDAVYDPRRDVPSSVVIEPGEQYDRAVVAVTPALAERWLARNHDRQRPLNLRTIERYAADMLAGRWKVNHEGLVFSARGLLTDGQRRLQAIRQCGATVTMTVYFYHDDTEFEGINQGEGRTIGHRLEMRGLVGKGQGRSFGALAACVFRIESGVATVRPSDAQIEDVIARYSAAMNALADRNHGRSRVRSPARASFVYLYAGNPDAVTDALRKLDEGDGLTKESGLWLLRRALDMDTEMGRTSYEESFATTLRALLALRLHFAGESRKILKSPREDEVAPLLAWAKEFRALPQKLASTKPAPAPKATMRSSAKAAE